MQQKLSGKSLESPSTAHDEASRMRQCILGRGSENCAYNATTSNLKIKGAWTLVYTDPNHSHAVTAASGNSYAYDANGNQVPRVICGNTHTLTYAAENRLVQVSGAATASFVYDGDGKRVLAIQGGTTTVFIGNYFEWSGRPPAQCATITPGRRAWRCAGGAGA